MADYGSRAIRPKAGAGWIANRFQESDVTMSNTAGHPWFKPLRRRVIITTICAAWVGFEIWQESFIWLLVACGCLGYAVYDFFLSGNYEDRAE